MTRAPAPRSPAGGAAAVPTLGAARAVVHVLLAALLAVAAMGDGGAPAPAPPVPVGPVNASLTLDPNQVYTKPETGTGLPVLVIPDTAIAGEPLGAPLPNVPSDEDCSQACRASPNCTLFMYCGAAAGCNVSGAPAGSGGRPGLAAMDCLLLRTNCSLEPAVVARGTLVASGFPIKQDPPTISGFTSFAARGVSDFDLPECPGTLLPGACAFSSLLSAASTCIRTPDCQSVVVYENGTDGCSSPISVLKRVGLNPANAFISPSVYTLQVAEAGIPENTWWLRASDGQVVLPTNAELAAGDAALSSNSSWKGCIIGNSSAMAGTVLRVLNGLASPEACCRACHNDSNVGSGLCNVWNFCQQAGGCRWENHDLTHETISLSQGQCQLRHQELTVRSVGSPPILLGQGQDVPFVSGAPVALWGPEIEGYERYIGQSIFNQGAFECLGSLRPQARECLLEGTPPQLADLCSADARGPCVAFLLKPGGIVAGQPYLGTVGFLKNATPPISSWVLNPTTVTYVSPRANSTSTSGVGGAGQGTSSSGSSSLSAGAIAGIAVGCAMAAAALALAAYKLHLRRRHLEWQQKQQEQQQQQQHSLPLDIKHKGSSSSAGGSVAACADLEAPPLPGSPFAQAAWVAPVAPTGAAASGTARSRASPYNSTGTQRTSDSAGSASSGLGGGGSSRAAGATGSCLGSPLSPAPLSPAPTGSDRVSGGGHSGEVAIIPELVQHVAAKDAAALVGENSLSPTPSSESSPGTTLESLPERLREWVVPAEEIVFQRWPNGKPVELGCGASAHVYKAELRGETVAAKEMNIESSPSVHEAFLTEALRLHSLRHPHIVGFFGVAFSGSKGIVLMELCEGRDLHSALEVMASGSSQRLFGWYRRGRRVAFELAKALNYLHNKGVVHLDVKSQNVLLTANGAVRLADVGFSRIKKHTYLTNLPLVGTFAWIAPEILMGRPATQAVDIYSMGVVLWEIVTGERPERGRLREPRVPQECPQEVASLIMTECLNEDPSLRPSAAQLVQRLGRWMEANRAVRLTSGRMDPEAPSPHQR